MRKFLVSLALGAATVAGTVAIPAAAQAQRSWQHPNGPTRGQINALLNDLNRAEQRIAIAQRRGAISPREALGLRREARNVRARLQFASRGGIGAREFANLRFQVNRLEQRIRMERWDRDGRRG